MKLITIDGPSASGKSSVSQMLAKKLAWPWVSTGVFYRGLALICLERNLLDPESPGSVFHEKNTSEKPIPLDKEKAVLTLANDPCWKVKMDEEQTRVFINGENRTGDIFSENISLVASNLSRLPRIREALLQPQKDCFNPRVGLVAEGRDCGTVIFPEAKLKIYLTANENTRTLRRYQQQQKGHLEQMTQMEPEQIKTMDQSDLAKTLKAQKFRDGQDSRRQAAPLQVPQGAFVIDSTSLSMEEVVNRVLDHARNLSLL